MGSSSAWDTFSSPSSLLCKVRNDSSPSRGLMIAHGLSSVIMMYRISSMYNHVRKIVFLLGSSFLLENCCLLAIRAVSLTKHARGSGLSTVLASLLTSNCLYSYIASSCRRCHPLSREILPTLAVCGLVPNGLL